MAEIARRLGIELQTIDIHGPDDLEPASLQAAHWRESDRVIRPKKPGNAGGGKDPDFWRAFEDGEVKVIGKSLQTPTRIRSLQRKLYRKAKAEPAYRFYLLYDKICR